jgi:hypothetical protein
MTQHPATRFLLASLFSLLPSASPLLAQSPPAAFVLRAGVVVDPAAATLYLMRPGGGVQAVSLPAGALLWESNDAAKPLQVLEGTLVAQAEGPEAATLDIALLDPRDGTKRGVAAIAVPEAVWTRVDDGLGRSTVVEAVDLGAGQVLVPWRTESLDMRGAEPEDDEHEAALPRATLRPARPDQTEGAAVIQLAGGRVSTPAAALAPVARDAGRPEVPSGQRAPVPADAQYLSVDGRHVLVSERIGDDSVWEKYRWTVYTADTQERVGSITSPFAQAAFFVFGAQLVYEGYPFLRRLPGGEVQDQPLTLRGADLRSGGEQWSRPLRDTSYRGPFPP